MARHVYIEKIDTIHPIKHAGLISSGAWGKKNFEV